MLKMCDPCGLKREEIRPKQYGVVLVVKPMRGYYAGFGWIKDGGKSPSDIVLEAKVKT